MNSIGYYWSIGSSRVWPVGAPGHHAFGGAIFSTIGRTPLDRRHPVIVHLDHPLMHVGDQIFFRPLVWRLKQAGFDVSVRNRPSVDFLFEDVRRAEGRPSRPGALVVLRHEALRDAWRFYGRSAEYFVVRQVSRGIRRPVANFILEAFADWFGPAGVDCRIDKSCFLPFPVRPTLVLKAVGLPETRPLIILSNYVDSGIHRKLWSREAAMLAKAAQLKNETGAAVVHVGTVRDRERDRRDYSRLVDHDLRGRTSVEDLFNLLGSPSIHRVFCFDTAILHIAYLMGVPTTLFEKYYFSRAERAQKAAAFHKFFERSEVEGSRPDATFGMQVAE